MKDGSSLETGASASSRPSQPHVYHDYSTASPPLPGNEPERGGTTFPLRLHHMLSQVEMGGLSHIVSWQPHGRCFIVHQQEEFVNQVLPIFFRQTRMASFQRQLNLYGFQRLTAGRDKNGYYHELFLRGKSFLVQKIRRIKIKGEGGRKPSAPQSEPDFYSMPTMPPAEKVQRKEADTKEAAASPHVGRLERSWPAEPTTQGSYPFLPPSLISLTATLPEPRMVSQMSNLALELALARALATQPTPRSTATSTLAEAMLLSSLPTDLLLLRDNRAASLLTSHVPLMHRVGSEAIPRTEEDRIAMMLKEYRR